LLCRGAGSRDLADRCRARLSAVSRPISVAGQDLREGFMGRLDGKIAIIVGAGQSPGEGIGNGRATALLFAREGAKVLAVDNRLASAEETAGMIAKDGGTAEAMQADAVSEADMAAV